LAERQIVELALNEVVLEDSYDARLNLDEEYVEWLAGSMERDGLEQPIKVRKADMKLIDGWHRIEAAKKLGWEKIPAMLLDVDPETAHLMAITANYRKNLSDLEWGRKFRQFLDLWKSSGKKVEEGIKEIIRRTGFSRTKIYDCIKLYEDLTPDLKVKLLSGEAPSSLLVKIAGLPKEVQSHVFSEVQKEEDEETRDILIRAAKAIRPEIIKSKPDEAIRAIRQDIRKAQKVKKDPDRLIALDNLPIGSAIEAQLKDVKCPFCLSKASLRCSSCNRELPAEKAEVKVMLLAPISRFKAALRRTLETLEEED